MRNKHVRNIDKHKFKFTTIFFFKIDLSALKEYFFPDLKFKKAIKKRLDS